MPEAINLEQTKVYCFGLRLLPNVKRFHHFETLARVAQGWECVCRTKYSAHKPGSKSVTTEPESHKSLVTQELGIRLYFSKILTLPNRVRWETTPLTHKADETLSPQRDHSTSISHSLAQRNKLYKNY